MPKHESTELDDLLSLPGKPRHAAPHSPTRTAAFHLLQEMSWDDSAPPHMNYNYLRETERPQTTGAFTDHEFQGGQFSHHENCFFLLQMSKQTTRK
jgi:hypothetical protein